MTTSTLALPKTADQLRSAIKAAITFYQGSPVKNDNKLNEALAVALGVGNYDRLSALLQAEQDNSEIIPYDICFDYTDAQQLIINGVRIDNELTHHEVVAYTVANREESIREIRQWIAEAQCDPRRSHDVYLMQEDLDTLLASDDEYVLEAVGTNGFIAGDVNPVEFNQACDEILKNAAEHYQELVGKPSKTGTRHLDFYHYHEEYPIKEVYDGELVLIKQVFVEDDDQLPIGMSVEKYTGQIPEGYTAAYAGVDHEYVPIKRL